MNAPNVTQLPRPVLPQAELEAKVVAAALNLGIELSEFEALGLAREDFSVELYSKAWAIARRSAEAKKRVSAETVGSAGLNASWFTPPECAQLEQLANGSPLTVTAFRQVAADLRVMVLRQRFIARLQGEVREAMGGQWSPARAAQNLEGLASGLLRDTAPDEDAAGDVVDLLDGWDTNEKTLKSRLLPTRVAVLDAEYGGLPPGLTVFASAPGVGKTALLDSMIRAQLEADPELHLGFFGLEDGTSHIARRWMAADTGMLLRDIGWKQRTAEQRTATEQAAQRFHPLLSRLHVYRHDTITAAELVARIASMRSKYGIAAAYVDNLTEVDFAQPRERQWQQQEKEHQAIAELGRRLRNYGLRELMPIALIAHTIGALKAGDVPTPQDIAGGQALGRRVRLFCGLWAKGEEIRCTVSKANELGPSGVTVSFARLKTAGLIDPTQGEKINLQAERAAESREKARAKLMEREQLTAEKKARAAAGKTAEKVAEVKRDEAQQSLGTDAWLIAAGDKRGPRAE